MRNDGLEVEFGTFVEPEAWSYEIEEWMSEIELRRTFNIF
jgi:hypothetical protein